MQGDGDGDCAAGESIGSEGGAERSGKVNLAAAVLLAALAEQLNSSMRIDAALTATARRTASSAGQGGWPEHLSRPRRF